MTNLIVASAFLAATLAAEPAATAKKPVEKPAAAATAPGEKAEVKGAEKAKPAEPGKKETLEPVAKKPASPEALKDAVGALLGPCSPEMADGKVTAIEVLDGKQLNARLEKEKSKKAKALPAQRFISIGYEAGGNKGKSVRQVSTQYLLTTEQAQVLLGEKVCVFQE